MFPPNQFTHMTILTNEKLQAAGKTQTTKGEILKFFGILILITKFEFGSRASLWATIAPSKYVPAPQLGKTGMSRTRFDTLWRYMRWSYQPRQRPDGVSSERYRWMLVDDFVKHFNDHCTATFIPSSFLCVDESISRWYGLGGDWINIGLPMYVEIDRKPENGCEIQNAACGKSGIMISIRLVKTKVEEEANSIAEDERGMLHGTKVLLELVDKWADTDRIVCADSYFASVPAAEALLRIGLRFIGVVKTATKRYPMEYLSNKELLMRGDRAGVVNYGEDGRAKLLAFVWMDRNRRYFIASASSLAEGTAYVRKRWRQVNEELDADPERVELRIEQPKASQLYYDTCASIDQHNRHRQDTLKLETKVETHSWDKRVNTTLFGMCVVDTWLAWSQVNINNNISIGTQSDFYRDLAEELIDNNFDRAGTPRRGAALQPSSPSNLVDSRTGKPRAGVAAHLTPIKKKRRKKNGELTNHAKQGYCSICRRKTKYMCSLCYDENCDNHEIFLCGNETGRNCFETHLGSKHEQ